MNNIQAKSHTKVNVNSLRLSVPVFENKYVNEHKKLSSAEYYLTGANYRNVPLFYRQFVFDFTKY